MNREGKKLRAVGDAGTDAKIAALRAEFRAELAALRAEINTIATERQRRDDLANLAESNDEDGEPRDYREIMADGRPRWISVKDAKHEIKCSNGLIHKRIKNKKLASGFDLKGRRLIDRTTLRPKGPSGGCQ
jgi:hypothetical protein